MSQSPSYQTDTAAVSPESPKEGDFSSRQLSDNLKSLEEHETCHRTEPSSSSTSIKEKVPVSPELMEVRALDGRFITLVSSQTQTDWEWVEQSLFFNCQVQKEIEEMLLLAEVVSVATVPESSEETESDSVAEVYDIPCVGLPRLIAYKPELKQIPHVQKVPEVQSKQDVHLAQCDYCQQLCQPFIHWELLQNETDFGRLICCEQAKQMRELILKEREKLAQIESNIKINVNPTASIISEEERETAKALAKERLRVLQIQRKSKRDNMSKDSSHIEIKHKTSYRLSKEIPNINDEPHISQIDIKNTTGMFTLQEETDGKPKLKEVTKKFYKSGKCFLTLCPDGTGNVLQSYPSGNAAIIISSAEADDFTYIILDDKDVAPSMKAIFTNKGHSTCYHPNGMIWLNLTPFGGLSFSETGDLRRRWNWWYFDPQAHKLPFKPLTFGLCPHISVRIHSQECMYVTLAHQENTMRFSVGSKLKLICPESHGKPGQDIVEGYIKMKSSKIYSLLGQMQTFMSHHSANQHNIKPHNSFSAQKQKLGRKIKREKSPEKIKAHEN